MKQDHQSKTDRRSFLKLAGFGAAGTVAVAASTVTASADDLAPKNDGQYRETVHVKRVYELSRF